MMTGWSRDTGSRALVADARTGLLRATMLFGSIAVALSMIVVPMADRHARTVVAERDVGLDEITTGSIGFRGVYTATRSVLQANGAGPCLLFPDGTHRGAC